MYVGADTIRQAERRSVCAANAGEMGNPSRAGDETSPLQLLMNIGAIRPPRVILSAGAAEAEGSSHSQSALQLFGAKISRLHFVPLEMTPVVGRLFSLPAPCWGHQKGPLV